MRWISRSSTCFGCRLMAGGVGGQGDAGHPLDILLPQPQLAKAHPGPILSSSSSIREARPRGPLGSGRGGGVRV